MLPGDVMGSPMSIMRMTFCVFILFYSSFSIQPQKKSTSVDSSCVIFETPRYGSIIKSPTCTLSLSTCPNVESIHLTARFFPGSGIMDTILDLGTITQPPFKLIWNIAELPNQLFRGMWFVADAAFKNGKHMIVRQDGVFLYPRHVSAKEVTLPSSAEQQKLFFIDTLPSIEASVIILNVSGNWNSQGLHFTVLVIDPSFSMAVPKEKLPELGVVVCIDPFMTKSAYPTKATLIISFPLLSKPMRFIYNKVNDQKGIMNFTVDTMDFPYPATIKTAEGKGYGLDITLPRGAFNNEMPESLLCNILMKVADRHGRISIISSNRVSSREALSPLLWTTIRRTQGGFLRNPLYVFLACFGGGALLAFVGGYAILSRSGKTVAFNKIALSEEDKQLAKTAYGYLEKNMTNKDMTLSVVARELSISGSKIESLIKKYNNLSFKKYLMHARVEIAKERLRSSHASESSIAESCGFKSIDEMEKSFVKLCHTTPFKYRSDNQVA